MRKAPFVTCLGLLVALSAAPARAQGFVAPFVGYDFGGDAGNCPSLFSDCTEKKTSYGVVFGFLAGGFFGVEADIGYAPDFFGESQEFGDNSVLTFMTNLVIGIPAGGVRPYASAGLGLMRTHARLDTIDLGTEDTQNAWAYDVGGGVMFFLPYHLGIRADYRYFRSLQNFEILSLEVRNPKLSFSRVSVGLVIH